MKLSILLGLLLTIVNFAHATNTPDRPNINVDAINCVCQMGKVSMGASCERTCADTDTNYPLFMGEAESNNTHSLEDWCYKAMSNQDPLPSCWLEVFDGVKNTTKDIDVSNNSYTSSLVGLKYNQTYVAKLISSTGARSNAFQFRFKTVPMLERAITTDKVNRYQCGSRSGDTSDSGSMSKVWYVNYNYNEMFTPSPLSRSNEFFYCHDRTVYGPHDRFEFPRLGQQYAYKIWSPYDVNFIDFDQDGKPDINNKLESYISNTWGLNYSLDLFQHLELSRGPQDGLTSIGYFLYPFYDRSTGRNICIGSKEYQGSDPLYVALGHALRSPTEKVYLASGEAIYDDNGYPAPDDLIVIRESELNKLWYYFNNTVAYAGSTEASYRHQLYFNWPFDFTNPLLKRADQRRYKLIYPSEIGLPIEGDYRTRDKSFGCIPQRTE